MRSWYLRPVVLVVVTLVGAGLAGCSTSPAAPPPVVAAAPVSTTPALTTAMPTTPPTPAPTAATTRPKPIVKSTTAAKATAKNSSKFSSTGCAQRAVTAGKFNPSCQEYQGYLDPGTAGGRAPSSGNTQLQYACQTGQAPKSECLGNRS